MKFLGAALSLLLLLFCACGTETTQTFTVTFDTNGGNTIAPQTTESGKTAAKPDTDPTKDGYTFKGWFTDATGDTAFDFSKAITTDTTVYAQWTQTFDVIFDTQGGNTIASQTIESGQKATEPTNPARDGYTFASWNTEADGGGTDFDFNTAITEDMTLYAQWFFDIPDANFRTALKDIVPDAFTTINEKDYLMPSHQDVKSLKVLDIRSKEITSLEGIQFFTALTNLYCNSNQLTTLDVSNNTALKDLDCNNNELTTLDVSNNTNLTELDCNNNALTTLDVSENTAMTELNCFSNQLTTLDVSNNTNLTYLDCNNNALTTLDVSNNTAMSKLYCNNSKLTTLDVSNNTNLTELDCNNNALTTLDVSNNTNLTYLDCNNNKLTTLDVSKNTALTVLACNSNQLTTLDISNNTDLTTLFCNSNQLTTLDVSKNTDLTYLTCNSNQLTTLDMRGMRSVGDQALMALDIGVNDENPVVTLRVHDNLKNNPEVKAAKSNRGENITIEVYTAVAGSDTYTISCSDYDPNAANGGTCLVDN